GIDLLDPSALKGNRLHGAGLRVGQLDGQLLRPVAVIRNTADVESEVFLRLNWSNQGGSESNEIDVPAVRLGAREVRDLSHMIVEAISALPVENLNPIGIELRSSTGPGTIVALVQSVSGDGEHVFEVPLIDPGTKGSAGNYPWSISELSSTYLHVKNTSDDLQYFKAQFDFEGGAYVFGPVPLKPGQSETVDVRELRDSQIADNLGEIIPSDATHGQIHWSVVGPNARNHTLIGRSEQIDRRGIAWTFACDLCCPDSYDWSWVAPVGGDQLPVGLTSGFTAWQRDRDCLGMVL